MCYIAKNMLQSSLCAALNQVYNIIWSGHNVHAWVTMWRSRGYTYLISYKNCMIMIQDYDPIHADSQ